LYADIRVDWKIYNIEPHDGKYVDLVMSIGEPFPKKSTLLGTTLNDHTKHNNGLLSKSESCLQQPSWSSVDAPVALSESQLDNEATDISDIITAFIQPHEGVPSSNPFDINPKQIVIPANGISSVEVVFQPTVEALNELGSNLTSYALGYLSLDEESPSNVSRLCGYDVDPVRIDILADIEHAK